MNTSDAGLEFVARWEGERLTVYDDAGGKPTIGIGHLVVPPESFPNGIDHNEAIALLRKDIQIAESHVNACPRPEGQALTQPQFDALVSFTFNCGGGAFDSSLLRTYLVEGADNAAAGQFERWSHVNGVLNEGLLARRKAEEALFRSGMQDITNPSTPQAKATA